MLTAYVGGQMCSLDPQASLAQGGEAYIFRHGQPSLVLKRYKEPDDPTYHGNPDAQNGARMRLDVHQSKLRAFPTGLPDHVVVPQELAFDRRSGGRIVGYTMRELRDMEVLLSFANFDYREKGGIDNNRVVTIYRNLHRLVSQIHGTGIVIGDFNDLNVLVSPDDETFLVDADSMQFGRFLCRAFTGRFVDPLLCEPDKLLLSGVHNVDSDWYAFLIMLCQAMLYVGPYGGNHKPKDKKVSRVRTPDKRVLQRLTIFNPDVKYSDNLPPMSVLPDELLEHVQLVTEKDKRGVFPLRLIENLRWTSCSRCGALHARAVCPTCSAAVPGAVKQTVVIHGEVKATRIFATSGNILHAVLQDGKLRYLYHESDELRREDGSTVARTPLRPDLRYRIQGDVTLLGRRNQLLIFAPGQAVERLDTDIAYGMPVFDANDSHRYWVEGSFLMRDQRIGSFTVGQVLQGQTLFWTGRRFGFGFYRAGQLMRSFVFDAEGRGLNDAVPIPAIPGQLIDATCVFGGDLAWFMVGTQDAGQLINRCYVINRQGGLVAQAEALSGDGSWLGASIRGHMVLGSSLMAATDDGIVAVGIDGTAISVKGEFPSTDRFVDATTRLLPAPQGIYAVSNREITLLEIRQSS